MIKSNYLVNLAALMGVAFLLTSITLAQPNRRSPEDRAAQLKKDLELTDEQTAKVQQIYADQQKEMQKLFDADNGDRASRREVMQAKAKETDEKISALLNDQQKAKYQELVKQRRNRMQNRPPRN